MPAINNSRILIIATDGFEQSELFDPRDALIEAGASVTLASPDLNPIQGMKHDEKGDTITPDIRLDAVRMEEYDALLLPGGVANPDTLRTNATAVSAVRAFVTAGKPVAAICHGPWLLVEADVVRGRRMTSWPSLRTDLRNAAYDHLMGQPLDYFDRRKTGDLVSRLTGDIGIILNSISNIVAAFIREPQGDEMCLEAAWGEPGADGQGVAGQPLVRAEHRALVHTFADAEALGERVAASLRAGGAVWAAPAPQP